MCLAQQPGWVQRSVTLPNNEAIRVIKLFISREVGSSYDLPWVRIEVVVTGCLEERAMGTQERNIEIGPL